MSFIPRCTMVNSVADIWSSLRHSTVVTRDWHPNTSSIARAAKEQSHAHSAGMLRGILLPQNIWVFRKNANAKTFHKHLSLSFFFLHLGRKPVFPKFCKMMLKFVFMLTRNRYIRPVKWQLCCWKMVLQHLQAWQESKRISLPPNSLPLEIGCGWMGGRLGWGELEKESFRRETRRAPLFSPSRRLCPPPTFLPSHPSLPPLPSECWLRARTVRTRRTLLHTRLAGQANPLTPVFARCARCTDAGILQVLGVDRFLLSTALSSRLNLTVLTLLQGQKQDRSNTLLNFLELNVDKRHDHKL